MCATCTTNSNVDLRTRPLVGVCTYTVMWDQDTDSSFSQFEFMMLVCFTVSLFLASCGCALAQTGLSTSEKQDLLDAHNYFRSRVSPIATDMEIMVEWIRIISCSLIE